MLPSLHFSIKGARNFFFLDTTQCMVVERNPWRYSVDLAALSRVASCTSSPLVTRIYDELEPALTHLFSYSCLLHLSNLSTFQGRRRGQPSHLLVMLLGQLYTLLEPLPYKPAGTYMASSYELQTTALWRL